MKLHVWMQRSHGMSEEDFRDYFLQVHAPLVTSTYEYLSGYSVDFGADRLGGESPGYDALCRLSWDDEAGFRSDMRLTPRLAQDLAHFTDDWGAFTVEETVVR